MALPRNIPDWAHSAIFSLKSDLTFTQNIWIYSSLLGTTIFWQTKMMCPMGAFCLQRKPNVAYESSQVHVTAFCNKTWTCNGLPKNLSSAGWQNKAESCQCVPGPSQSSPTKPIIPSDAHCDFSAWNLHCHKRERNFMTSQATLVQFHTENITKCFQQKYNQWACCLKSQGLLHITSGKLPSYPA